MTGTSANSTFPRSSPICVKCGLSSASVCAGAFVTTCSPSNHTSTAPFAGSFDQVIRIAIRCHTPAVTIPS